MLPGTGIGIEAYSVIEQGKVDILLQASAKDRRVIFEEAAGISRFKARRSKPSDGWNAWTRTYCGSPISSTRSRVGSAASAPRRARHDATRNTPTGCKSYGHRWA